MYELEIYPKKLYIIQKVSFFVHKYPFCTGLIMVNYSPTFPDCKCSQRPSDHYATPKTAHEHPLRKVGASYPELYENHRQISILVDITEAPIRRVGLQKPDLRRA
jgi:hypothetical protein